jgi:hypothetical protein
MSSSLTLGLLLILGQLITINLRKKFLVFMASEGSVIQKSMPSDPTPNNINSLNTLFLHD